MSGPGSGSPSDDSDRNDSGDRSPDAPSSGADRTRSREPTRSDGNGPAAEASRADAPRAPNPEPGTGAAGDGVTIEDDGLVRWFLRTNNGTVVAIRDVASSVAIVAFIGLLLFGISGVWPPLVAVESGSMEPHMERGDLVFVADETRFVGDDPTGDTGVVTLRDGASSGHEKFGEPGDVIIFMPNGFDHQTPIIHRAHFWVEEGDNWVEEEANPEYLNGATTCEQVRTCPAEHDGFITKGDANSGYDQLSTAGARTDVVKPEWITGKGMFRIPWLGHVRLTVDEVLATTPTGIDAGYEQHRSRTLESSAAVVSATADDGSKSASSTNSDSTAVVLERPAGAAGITALAGAGAGSLVLVGRWRTRRRS